MVQYIRCCIHLLPSVFVFIFNDMCMCSTVCEDVVCIYAAAGVYLTTDCLYIRCPQPGEGVDLLLRVLAELPGDFSGLRQLLRQVGLDVFWQLLVRGGQRTHWNWKMSAGVGIQREKKEMREDKELRGGDMKKKVRIKKKVPFKPLKAAQDFNLQCRQLFSLICITGGCGPADHLKERAYSSD